MKNFVYVVSGEHGRQKIGSSDNPKQRLKELQTGSPYPLHFEFIGEVENGAAGQVEVETHFTLNQHRTGGGDEWFMVPADVAITAVMAAAHRLGYRCRPVDAERVQDSWISLREPWWVLVAMLPVYGWFLYWVVFDATPRITSGEMSLGTFAIEAAVLFGLIRLLQWIAKRAGHRMIADWQSSTWFKPQA